jgi:hypothetical protein
MPVSTGEWYTRALALPQNKAAPTAVSANSRVRPAAREFALALTTLGTQTTNKIGHWAWDQ